MSPEPLFALTSAYLGDGEGEATGVAFFFLLEDFCEGWSSTTIFFGVVIAAGAGVGVGRALASSATAACSM